MKKMVFAITFAFLLLSCGPSEQEKLFEGDNPLIGTWEEQGIFYDGSNATGDRIPNPQLVFVDDSTVHDIDPYFGKDDVYTYAFDHTDTISNSQHDLHNEPAMFYNIFRPNDILTAIYLPNKKILFYSAGNLYKKIKK